MRKIKLGLPKGSLNQKGRGNTCQVFVDAGYEIAGYEPGNESDKRLAILNDPEIEPFLCRPQSAPAELASGMLDAAIIGEDWVKEYGFKNIQKVGDLEYGKTRLVFAVSQKSSWKDLSDFFVSQKGRKEPILCSTEYVNLARKSIMRNDGYLSVFGDIKPLVKARALSQGKNKKVQIINSDGVTEGYIAKGADIIADNTQTGKTLKEYGLKELERIMDSSAGLFVGSLDGWKDGKAKEIYQQLYGAIEGKKYFDVKFNVPNEQFGPARDYLISQKLCSDEPTVSKGERYSAINILIPRERFPSVIRELKNGCKASAIVRDEVKQFIR